MRRPCVFRGDSVYLPGQEVPKRLKPSRADCHRYASSRVLASHSQLKIAEILHVDRLCRFTDALRSPGKEAPPKNVLLAALIAHGTNLGISAMGHSAEGITVDLLRNASQWFHLTFF